MAQLTEAIPATWFDRRNEAISEYYDGLLKDYERFWGLKKHLRLHYGYFDENHRSFGEALENLDRVMTQAVDLKPGERVIDAGCGVGGSSIYMAKHVGAVVTGVNISDHQLSYARRAAAEAGVGDRITFVKADMCRTGLSPQSFDVFYAIDSVGHAESLERLFEEAFRILKPSGRLVYTEFVRGEGFTESDWRRNDRINEGMGGDAPCHTVEDLRRALESTGFVDVAHSDISDRIRPSMKRARRMALLGMAYTWLLVRLRRRTQLHYRAAVAVAELAGLCVDGRFRYVFGTARRGRHRA